MADAPTAPSFKRTVSRQVREALDRHNPKRYIERLRGIFRELALAQDSDTIGTG